MQDEICPRMGLVQHTVRMLLAWAHLRQYLQQGDERMLARTRDLLKGPASEACDGVNASLQAASRSAIHTELKERAGDLFELCTAEQAPLVLDVVQLTAPSQEQRADAARELYVSSVDAELDRCWASAAGQPEVRGQGNTQAPRSGSGRVTASRAPSEAVKLFLMTAKVCNRLWGRVSTSTRRQTHSVRWCMHCTPRYVVLRQGGGHFESTRPLRRIPCTAVLCITNWCRAGGHRKAAAVCRGI